MTSALQWLTGQAKTKTRVFDIYGPDMAIRADVLSAIEMRVGAQERVVLDASEIADSEIWQTVATAPLASVKSRIVVIFCVDRIKDWSGLDRFIKDKSAYAETVLVLVSDRAEAGYRHRKVDPKIPGKVVWETKLADWEQWIHDYSAGTSIACITPSIELPATGTRGGVGALSPLARWLSYRVEMTQSQAEYLWTRAGEQTTLARDVAEQIRIAGRESVRNIGMTEFKALVNAILTAHGSEDFAEQVLFGRKHLALASLVDHEFSAAEWSKILGYLSQRLDWLAPLHEALGTSERLDQVQRRLNIHRKWILQYAHREDPAHNIAKNYDRPTVARRRLLLADLDAALSTFHGVPVAFGEVLLSAW